MPKGYEEAEDTFNRLVAAGAADSIVVVNWLMQAGVRYVGLHEFKKSAVLQNLQAAYGQKVVHASFLPASWDGEEGPAISRAADLFVRGGRDSRGKATPAGVSVAVPNDCFGCDAVRYSSASARPK